MFLPQIRRHPKYFFEINSFVQRKRLFQTFYGGILKLVGNKARRGFSKNKWKFVLRECLICGEKVFGGHVGRTSIHPFETCVATFWLITFNWMAFLITIIIWIHNVWNFKQESEYPTDYWTGCYFDVHQIKRVLQWISEWIVLRVLLEGKWKWLQMTSK